MLEDLGYKKVHDDKEKIVFLKDKNKTNERISIDREFKKVTKWTNGYVGSINHNEIREIHEIMKNEGRTE